MSCFFCEKLRQLDALSEYEVVWRFPNSVALLGTWQYFRGYCILVAREHAKELFDLPDAERQAYFEEMCVLAKAIHVSLQPHKLNYEMLGNQVPHLHWHLFPRFTSDPDALRPVWFTIDRAEHDKAERARLLGCASEFPSTASRLRDALKELGAPRGR
jgi:diadenosine tetraphosphate (Ap4A) HIT family hydrolase